MEMPNFSTKNKSIFLKISRQRFYEEDPKIKAKAPRISIFNFNNPFKSRMEKTKKKFFKDEYQWNLYKKNFFVIYFYIFKFIRCLKNTVKYKINNLKPFHFQVINDLSIESNFSVKKSQLNKLKSTNVDQVKMTLTPLKKKRKKKNLR